MDKARKRCWTWTAGILLAASILCTGCDRSGTVPDSKISTEGQNPTSQADDDKQTQKTKYTVVAKGLENPCGVVVQPESGHILVSMRNRIVRLVPGKPFVLSDEITDFPTDSYQFVPIEFGPLGLAFSGKDVLVVGDGSLPDGQELVRFYRVGLKPRPEGRALRMQDMHSFSGPFAAGEDSGRGEGNFYGIAIKDSTIFVTCNGDDSKGWISKIELVEGKPGPILPFIKGKVETEVDAPASAVITPEGKLLVSQLGELIERPDSLLAFYDPSTGKLERKLAAGLRDLTAVAYSPTSGELYGTDFSWVDASNGGLFHLEIKGDNVIATKILDLDKPTAMAFAADGTLYVTIIGTATDGKMKPGELWRISGL